MDRSVSVEPAEAHSVQSVSNVGFKTIEGMSIPNHLGIYYRESDQILVKLERNEFRLRPNRALIMLLSQGLIQRILFTDFDPKITYGISCNGNQITGSCFSHEDQCQVIDFSNIELNNIMRVVLEQGISEDEPPIPSYPRHLYLNVERVDNITIHPSNGALKKRLLQPTQTLTLEGYFKVDNHWVETTRQVTIYPYTTYQLPLHHPTSQIEVSCMCSGKSPTRFQLWVDGILYREFHDVLVLDRKEINSQFVGVQNLSIPEGLDTLNFSRVTAYLVIIPEPDLSLDWELNVNQDYYQIYDVNSLHHHSIKIYSN